MYVCGDFVLVGLMPYAQWDFVIRVVWFSSAVWWWDFVYRCMAGSAYVMGTLRYMCDTLNKKALL